ncbi:MAG: hypothetical protein ACTSY1_07525 [Alphaproteobacteria bacterium]
MSDIENFISQGQSTVQLRFQNIDDHPLGYAVINGQATRGPDFQSFTRDKVDVHLFELFSDGYLSVPTASTALAWEQEFSRIEREDPSKTHHCAAIKGSMDGEFSDDRSVLIVAL